MNYCICSKLLLQTGSHDSSDLERILCVNGHFDDDEPQANYFEKYGI